MVRLLKAEFSYNIYPIAVLFFLIILIQMPQKMQYSDILGFLAPMIAFIMVSGLVDRSDSEKRERRFILLPISHTKIAAARLLYIYLPLLLVIAIYFILNLIREPADSEFPPRTVTFTGMFLFIYLLIAIFRDLFIGSMKITDRTIMQITITVFVTIFLWVTFIEMIVHPRIEAPAWYIERLIEIFESAYSTGGTAVLYAMSLSLSYLSVFTFLRRRSYIK